MLFFALGVDQDIINENDHEFIQIQFAHPIHQIHEYRRLPNDIYSLIDSNETAKDLWDVPERQMHGSEYTEQDRKAVILYEYETFKATEGEQLLDTYIRYLQVINDLNKCGCKKDNCELNYKFLNNLQPEWKCDVNDALGYKKKVVMVTSDPLALVAEKTKVSKRKEKVEVQTEFEGSDDDDISDLKKITVLLAMAFNQKKYYAKPTNNNLRTSSASSSVNKKPGYVKSVEKKEDKKADEKKRDMRKVKCYNCKKEGHFAKDCKKAKVKDYNYYKTKMLLAKKDSDKQVLLDEDQAWMESRSDSDQEINANMKVYYVEGLGHNLFSVRQFCDKGLEVAFRKSTCFVRNEDGVDLLTGDRSLNLYTVAFNEVASNSSTYLLAKASSSQSWLTPQQNGVVERRNQTLVEAAKTMLTFANLPLFLWAEAIATACFTQNCLIIHKRFDKTPYELMNKRKPNIKFFRVFGCRCYLLNDYEDVRKLKAKGDIGVFAGYSKESAAFRIYNKQTRKIHESVNIIKSSTSNVESSNVEFPSHEEEVFHENSESFQEESSSSSLNDDV
nr:retrovirus-related Pol polyprotein from transposon TNT 1-94 [Tanacetum cinerariifolium]